jgi:hypothetical protein
LIIGAQRAGSTFLHDLLSARTSANPSPLRKEVHYFDNKYYKGIEWYRKCFGTEKGKIKNFETSPYYLYHPAVPKRVSEEIPDVKLIIILRNPVDRAISQYKWMRQIGLEKRNAEDAFKKDVSRMHLEENEEYLKEFDNPLHFSYSHAYNSYIRRSMYGIQLNRWLKYFDEQQIKIVSSKLVFNRPKVVVQKIKNFLRLGKSNSNKNNQANKNSTHLKNSVSPEARIIAERNLQKVVERVNDMVPKKMIIGESISLQ